MSQNVLDHPNVASVWKRIVALSEQQDWKPAKQHQKLKK